MILQWTSSVNNLTLPTDGLAQSDYTTTYDYEDVMKHHVWNLYTNLVEKGGWLPVSASYSSSIGYNLTASGWPTKNNLAFPDSMTTTSIDDIQNLLTVTYQPTDHCWVTLKKTFNNSNYFMTLDCRYPLPPHKSNANIIYNKLKDTSVDPPIISYEQQRRVDSKKVFIGPASIVYDKTLTNFEGKPAEAWLNKQETNMFNGVAYRDTVDTVLDMTPAVIATGQDYISRCVGFIDISFNQGEDNSIAYYNGSTYKSATTKVRPKNGKNDANSWYVCWGFDFIDTACNSVYDATTDFI